MVFFRYSFPGADPSARSKNNQNSSTETVAETSISSSSFKRRTIGCEFELHATLNHTDTTSWISTTTKTTRKRSFSVHHASHVYERELRRSLEEYRPEPEEEEEEETEVYGSHCDCDDLEDVSSTEQGASGVGERGGNEDENHTEYEQSASTVRFAETIEIRKFPLQLGDNPSCNVWKGSEGPPLTLGWNCVEVEVTNVFDPDTSWHAQRRPRRRTRQEREHLLLHGASGSISKRDVERSIREVCKIQKQRQQSRQESHSTSLLKLQMERIRSKLLNFASFGARKRQERAYLKECGVRCGKRRQWELEQSRARRVSITL